MNTHDLVMEKFGDILIKEDQFLGMMSDFLGDLADYLYEKGVEGDLKFEILDSALEAAKQASVELYRNLSQIVMGSTQMLSPEVESRVAPLGHPSRELSLYMEGISEAHRLSPYRVFHDVFETERYNHIHHIKHRLVSGSISSEEIWSQTQGLLLMDSTLPSQPKDEKAEHGQRRKKAALPLMAFAVGNLMRDQGVDLLKEMMGDLA